MPLAWIYSSRAIYKLLCRCIFILRLDSTKMCTIRWNAISEICHRHLLTIGNDPELLLHHGTKYRSSLVLRDCFSTWNHWFLQFDNMTLGHFTGCTSSCYVFEKIHSCILLDVSMYQMILFDRHYHYWMISLDVTASFGSNSDKSHAFTPDQFEVISVL